MEIPTVKVKKSVDETGGLRSASWPGLLAMGLSFACALGYAWTQIPDRPGFAGEVEKQWRDGRLYPIEGGPIKFVSGDLSGSGVSDPQFGVVLPSAVLYRSVKSYQYVEVCPAPGKCAVRLGWVDGYVDASKFQAKGYANIAPPSSLVFASRVMVGKSGVSAKAVSKLTKLAIPYAVGADNNDVLGLLKADGGYQNFQGEPKLGSFKISYRHVPLATGVTMAGDLDQRGDLAPGPGDRFIAKQGAMKPHELLELEFWQLPRFGFALLAICAMLFIAGIFAMWSANKIERQIVEERRRKERRKDNRPDRRSTTPDRRAGSRRG